MIPKRAKRRAARLSNQICIVLGFEPVCGQFPACIGKLHGPRIAAHESYKASNSAMQDQHGRQARLPIAT